MVHVYVTATHVCINPGPVIGGWRAAYMPPVHYPTPRHNTHAACPHKTSRRPSVVSVSVRFFPRLLRILPPQPSTRKTRPESCSTHI